MNQIYSQFFRTLNCMIGQMKHILAAEQKKTDFKPEDENNVLIQYTNVSKTVYFANKYICYVNTVAFSPVYLAMS